MLPQRMNAAYIRTENGLREENRKIDGIISAETTKARFALRYTALMGFPPREGMVWMSTYRMIGQRKHTMYIELFLLDNLLMNLLIVRLAAALLSVRPPLYRQLAAASASAAYAALAAYLLPWLSGPAARPLPLALMAGAIPAKTPKGFLHAAVATLFATLTAGGAALVIALAFGGGVINGFIAGGAPLRTALLAAAAASVMPRAVRSILLRRAPSGLLVELTIEHAGITRSFTALVDTGNGLAEPLTGLPIAVLSCRALARYARLPVRVNTAGGQCVLYAFKPDRMLVEGMPVSALVAVTGQRMRCDALVPPSLYPEALTRKADHTNDPRSSLDRKAEAQGRQHPAE